MKPKYKPNEIVKIKATGEKVKIIRNIAKAITGDLYKVSTNRTYWESELAPYRPSRTGKLRDAHGRFMSEKKFNRLYIPQIPHPEELNNKYYISTDGTMTKNSYTN